MTVTHVAGIDPGLVHTGGVYASFFTGKKEVEVQHQVFADHKVAAAEVRQWLTPVGNSPWPDIFVEKYRPRAHLREDKRMVQLEHELRQRLPSATFLDNTGVKQVIRPKLMQQLDMWRFSTRTNHDDLRSAARILLLGMLKDPEKNAILTRFVKDLLDGVPWVVTSIN